jgi:hypothetical protein
MSATRVVAFPEPPAMTIDLSAAMRAVILRTVLVSELWCATGPKYVN